MNWFKRAEGGEEGDGGFRHLERWKTPRYYSGESWDGWYAAPVGRSRDSDTVERSNWEVQLERIPESETVQVVREGHWAVGWVEWLAIHESDRGALGEAEKIGEELENYPMLDEDHHSQLEWETMEGSGMIYNPNSSEWVDKIEGEWKGYLRNIELSEFKGLKFSGTFTISFKVDRNGMEVTDVDPVHVELHKPNGLSSMVYGDEPTNPGLFKALVRQLMDLGYTADEEPIFGQMWREVKARYGL